MSTKKPENPYLNLVFNLIIPSLLLIKGESYLGWSPIGVLLVALAFPFAYGLYDLWTRKTYNFLSIIGLVSVLITGGIGLLTLPTRWIAIKEAAIPALIGLGVIGSLKTRYPLIKTFLFNENLFQVQKIQAAIEHQQAQATFARLLSTATWALGSTFFLSAILNYGLAKVIVHSEAGTSAFTEEIGQMTLWSYPVILLPSMIMLVALMWWLLKRLENLTGLPLEDLFHDPKASSRQSVVKK